MTIRKNEEERQGAILLRYGKAIFLGGLVSFIAALCLLFLAAVGVSRGILDGELQYQLTVASCVLGSFLGGMISARNCPSHRLLAGLSIGAVLFLVQISLGLLLFEGATLERGGIGLLFGDLCGGAAAGILSGGGKRRSGGRAKRHRGR